MAAPAPMAVPTSPRAKRNDADAKNVRFNFKESWTCVARQDRNNINT